MTLGLICAIVNDWRLGRRALKIQISVMPPLPRTPEKLPEALNQSFRSPEEFVKRTGLYFKEQNVVLGRQTSKVRDGRRAVAVFRCARGRSPGKNVKASTRCECEYKLRLLEVKEGI